MGTIVKIDGCNVAVATGAAFIKVAQKFKSETGLTLHIKSGLRTRLEQTILWNDYMSGKRGLAAKPGTSEHETGRALDVYDSGTDPGVTVAGTTRHIILVRLMLEEGFKATGDTFGEPWHFEFWATSPYKIPASVSGSGSTVIENEDKEMNKAIGQYIGGNASTPPEKRVSVIYYPVSGFYTLFSGTDQAYINSQAQTHGTGNFTNVTENQWNQTIKPNLDKLLTK